jgi:hypothetical protein
MTADFIPPLEAFRLILRAIYPEHPEPEAIDRDYFRYVKATGDAVKSTIDASGKRSYSDEAIQKAADALKLLRDGIQAQKIELQGAPPAAPAGPPSKIGSRDCATGELDVWDETLEIHTKGVTDYTYRRVWCLRDDVLAMLGMPSGVSLKRWKNPTDEMVRAKVKEAYSEEKAAGRRAPNINEIPKFVRPKLNADGYDTSDNRIKKIADEPEFKALREPTGVRAT